LLHLNIDLKNVLEKYYYNDPKSFITIIKENEELDLDTIINKLINLADDKNNILPVDKIQNDEIKGKIIDGFAKLNAKIGA